MAETSRLGLPLLDPAQAQKHVTVNEALSRLDALTQIALNGIGVTQPPSFPAEGEIYAIGADAIGEWAGQDGALAFFLNNGWLFVAPGIGWRAWDSVSGHAVSYDGLEWVAGSGALSSNGAGFVHRTVEIDHAVTSGTATIIPAAIPADAIVYGVTGRILVSLGGAATFDVGVSGSLNRYGSGFGTMIGAWCRGMTGSPLTYYAPTDVVLTAGGGSFDGSGIIRLAVHFAVLTLPRI